MATAHLKGTDRFNFTPPGGVDTLHLLAVPLMEFEPIDPVSRYEWWSQDLTVREVVTVGAGVRELMVTIRCDNEPAALKTMLRAALLDDVTLTYRRAAAATAYPFKVVQIVGSADVALKPDRDRFGFGEWEVRLQLRRVDGGTVDDLL